MNKTQRRLIGYGTTAVVGFALVVAGTMHFDPDTPTMLSTVEVQLRLLNGMPAKDSEGNVLTERAKIQEEVRRSLAILAKRQPDDPVVLEFRAFFAGVDGRPQDAAKLYRRVWQLDDASIDEEQRSVLVFQESRMHELAGDNELALEAMELGADLVKNNWAVKFASAADLRRANLLLGLNRKDEAVAFARAAVERMPDSTPGVAVEAGLLMEQADHAAEAEAMYSAVAQNEPVANYHLAALKMRNGDVDNALEHLERVADGQPEVLRDLLQKDAKLWAPVRGVLEFQGFTRSDG